MYCKKPNPWVILGQNTAIVLFVFVLIDYIFYTWISPSQNPYFSDYLEKFIYTLFMAIAYAHVYNRASRMWRPNSDEAFVYKKKVVAPDQLCAYSWPKIANGIVFSFLVSVVIIMVLCLTAVMMSVVYVTLLHGIHGDYSLAGAAAVGTKIIAAGVALECTGQTEDDPDR